MMATCEKKYGREPEWVEPRTALFEIFSKFGAFYGNRALNEVLTRDVAWHLAKPRAPDEILHPAQLEISLRLKTHPNAATVEQQVKEIIQRQTRGAETKLSGTLACFNNVRRNMKNGFWTQAWNGMWVVDVLENKFTYTQKDAKKASNIFFALTDIVSLTRVPGNPQALRIGLSQPNGESSVRLESMMNHAEREMFIECLSVGRPCSRVYCPEILPENIDPKGKINQSNADGPVQLALSFNNVIAESSSWTDHPTVLDGTMCLRVSRALYEDTRVWCGTVNVEGVPFQSVELLLSWMEVDSQHDIYCLCVQQHPNFDELRSAVWRLAIDYNLFVAETNYLGGGLGLIVCLKLTNRCKLGMSCTCSVASLMAEDWQQRDQSRLNQNVTYGGVGIYMHYLNSTFGFIGVHLPSGGGDAIEGEHEVDMDILRRCIMQEVMYRMELGAPGTDTYTECDHLFVLGDIGSGLLNDPELFSSDPKITPNCQCWGENLCVYDQLTRDRARNRMLAGFTEPVISFPPTTPLSAMTGQLLWIPDGPPTSGKMLRSTRYSGRVLYRSIRGQGDVECLKYDAFRPWYQSGHHPVYGVFAVRVMMPVAHCIAPSLPERPPVEMEVMFSNFRLSKPLPRTSASLQEEGVHHEVRVSGGSGGMLFGKVTMTDPEAITTGLWKEPVRVTLRTQYPEIVTAVPINFTIVESNLSPDGSMDETKAAGSLLLSRKLITACDVKNSLHLNHSSTLNSSKAVSERIVAIYEYHAPNKLHTVEALLDQYRGRECSLLKKVIKRYGEEPTKLALHNESPRRSQNDDELAAVASIGNYTALQNSISVALFRGGVFLQHAAVDLQFRLVPGGLNISVV